MIEPLKPLIDSGLAVFCISDSNKTAPKPMKNAPFWSGHGQNKVLHPSHDVGAKIGIYFETTKKPPRSSLTVAGHLINL